MSKKKYTCNWPLKHNQKTYTDSVSLTVKEAEPLLAVGAVSLPKAAAKKAPDGGDDTNPDGGDDTNPDGGDDTLTSDDEASGD